MITYKDVRKLVRIEEQDNNSARFSDYDIKLATNKAIRYISSSQPLQNSDFLERYVDYDESEVNSSLIANGEEPISFSVDGQDLPEDFVSLISVSRRASGQRNGEILQWVGIEKDPEEWQYKVTNNKLFTGCRSVRLHYKAKLVEVTNDTSVIGLPDTYLDAVVNLVRMALNGDTSGFNGEVGKLVDLLVPRRRYRNTHIQMPWKV